MTFSQNFKNFLNILARKVFLIGRKRGFSVVPWYSKNHPKKENSVPAYRIKFIFDFKNIKFHKYPIRNKIDERVLSQVFLSLDYDLTRLRRGGNLSICIVKN